MHKLAKSGRYFINGNKFLEIFSNRVGYNFSILWRKCPRSYKVGLVIPHIVVMVEGSSAPPRRGNSSPDPSKSPSLCRIPFLQRLSSRSGHAYSSSHLERHPTPDLDCSWWTWIQLTDLTLILQIFFCPRLFFSRIWILVSMWGDSMSEEKTHGSGDKVCEIIFSFLNWIDGQWRHGDDVSVAGWDVSSPMPSPTVRWSIINEFWVRCTAAVVTFTVNAVSF